ncbi:unannotated protein [freshwater metagenome]|uniref:Unannotated protein n=1 Tax=freshwater metagenome TaxID=449393 RepID=A0A6J6P5A3_9ZZZZ
MMRFNVAVRLMNRPLPSDTPTVSLMMSSSEWASSMITTSCSGNSTPPLAMCNP